MTSKRGKGHGLGYEQPWKGTMTATIDKSASSITFVGPNGWKYSRDIVDPLVLDKVKVGDKVDISPRGRT